MLFFIKPFKEDDNMTVLRSAELTEDTIDFHDLGCGCDNDSCDPDSCYDCSTADCTDHCSGNEEW